MVVSVPPSSFDLFPADTKRKVEQISEELRSLDEMLAGNKGADGAVEVTAEETSSAPGDDLNHSNAEGALCYTANYLQNIVEMCQSTDYKYVTCFSWPSHLCLPYFWSR